MTRPNPNMTGFRETPVPMPVVWITVFLLALIAAAAVARRSLHLLTTVRLGRASATEAMDAIFVSHKGLTLLHIFAGFVFILLALIPFTRIRPASGSRMHLFLTNVLFALGTLVGVTAILIRGLPFMSDIRNSVELSRRLPRKSRCVDSSLLSSIT